MTTESIGGCFVADFPKISLVLGGVSSGKSAFAEQLTRCNGADRVYLATAQATDSEMTAKIARHRCERGAGWQTVEAPLDLVTALASIPANRVILLDCLTLWLSNHMSQDSNLQAETTALRASLLTTRSQIILVSNEVGLGGVAVNTLARRFQGEQGRLNQQMAALADLVVMVTAGIPVVIKGRLPGEFQ